MARTKVPERFREQATLPGKLSVVDFENRNGEIEDAVDQADYGLWPICEICNKSKSVLDSQVEPTEWNNHLQSHIS